MITMDKVGLNILSTEDARLFKRVLVWADPHCGHLVGLTPPEYWESEHTKWGQTERVCWNFVAERLEVYRPFDILIVNGDAVAGKNKKSGSRQLIDASMKKQCEIAHNAILFCDCKTVRMTRGTPYHVGADDNWEDILPDLLANDGIDATIKNHGFYNINGKIFDVKHKISGSSIPHGRLTAIAKEILWAKMWHDRDVQPLPDVLIRSHVHYYEQIYHDDCYGIVTAALQGLGDEFGEQQCSGTVAFGFVVIDVYNSGEIRIHPEIMRGELQSSQPEVL